MHLKKRLALATAVAALVLAAPAAAGAETLIGSGSTAAQPYFLALFKEYHKKHPSINFAYTANGGNAGVKDVQQGKSQFAGQARAPLPSDAGLTYAKGFLDGLCIVVNPKNGLTNLSTQQVSDIYTGKVTNWSAYPKSGLTSTIDPVGRDSNGGTYNFFVQAVLNGAAQASNVNALLSDGLVKNAVVKDKNAIGYNGYGYVKKGGLKALKLGGIPCAPGQIRTLKYPLSRYIFWVVPSSKVNPQVAKFIDWARTSTAAGTIITKVGGVAVFNKHAKKTNR